MSTKRDLHRNSQAHVAMTAAALMLALLQPATGQTPHPATPDPRLRACESGTPDEIINSCSILIYADQNTADRFSMLLNNRGIGFARSGLIDLAIADFTIATTLDAKNAMPLANLCRAWLEKQDGARAVAACTASIALNPKRYESYANRSLGYVLLGDYEKGLTDANTALEINPKCALTHANRGAIFEHFGRIDAAIADFAAAIELDPNFEWARERLKRLKQLHPEASGQPVTPRPPRGSAAAATRPPIAALSPRVWAGNTIAR